MADRLDLEQLRAAMDYGWKDWHAGESLHDTDIGALDTILDAARFLLSLADSGGRLVVETPCEHGDDWLTCDTEDCPGGSRRVVWPEEHQ